MSIIVIFVWGCSNNASSILVFREASKENQRWSDNSTANRRALVPSESHCPFPYLPDELKTSPPHPTSRYIHFFLIFRTGGGGYFTWLEDEDYLLWFSLMKLRIWGGGTHPGLCSWVLGATLERDRVLRQKTRRKCIWRQTGHKSRDANCYQKLSGGSRTRVSLMGPKKTRPSWHFDFNSNGFVFLYLYYLGTKENIYIVQVTQFVVICHCHRKLIHTTLALTFLVTFLTYSYLKRSSSILITKPCDPTTLTRSKQITPQLMSA